MASTYTPNQFTKVVVPAFRGDIGYETPPMLVAASQTIKAGDFLKLNAGKLEQAIALPGTDSTFSSAGSLGDLFIATADITTGAAVTDADAIPVIRFDAAVKVQMRFYNSTAANSELQDVALGASYQLGRWRGASSSIWWYAVSTTTTNGNMKLLERSLDSEATDDYGLGWFGNS